MKIEVSIDLLKDFFDNCDNCNYCKYKGTNCIGKSCSDGKIESLIEKSQLILDFDLAILELEKQKKKPGGVPESILVTMENMDTF